jgi:hypothetical protein
MTGGTTGSWRPAMTCTDVWISGSRVAQDGKLGRVGAHVAHRLHEAVAFVGRQVVLADDARELVPLDGGQSGGDDLARGSLVVLVQIRGFDPVLEHPCQLERDRRASTAYDEAAQPARMQRGGEQRGVGADVGADDVWVLEPERVGDANDELPLARGDSSIIAGLMTRQ